MNPFAVRQLAVGIIAWSCVMRLQQAVERMASGVSFTQAFAVEGFGPVLLVLVLLWRTGLLLRPAGESLTGVFVTVGMALLGISATQPMLRALLVDLPGWLVAG